MLRITPKQARTVCRLARDQCCNCVCGNCLLLDDGDSQPLRTDDLLLRYLLQIISSRGITG